MRIPRIGAPLLWAAILVGPFSAARAHKPSDSYLTLDPSGAEINVRWDVAVRDLDHALGLDRDSDGVVTWGDVRSRQAEIVAYALSRLGVATLTEGKATACPATPGDQLIVDHSDGAYVVLRFALRCRLRPASRLAVDYQLFFDLDPQHRGLLRVNDGTHRVLVFAAGKTRHEIDVASPDRAAQLGVFIREGIVHIWAGFDHVLFLLALLLPAVLRRERGHWRAVTHLRPVLWDVARIVTAFTLAHSITLSLAALDVLSLPSRLVEAAIAASVVLAALNNLRPVMGRDRWAVAFALGLLHGFGFSAVLSELGLLRENLTLALFGFNLGVEIGQLAIVAIFVPLAFALRGTALYRRAGLVGGSLGIVVLAAVWLVERATGLR